MTDHVFIPITAFHEGRSEARADAVIVEEPLEIRLGTKSLTITMRTPGDDFALTAGFLRSEGLIKTAADIGSLRHCGLQPGQSTSNIVRVEPRNNQMQESPRLERHFYASSSCGLCGKASLEALAIQAEPFAALAPPPKPSIVCALPERLRAAQRLFQATGGVHAAGLFDAEGRLLCAFEDVGRHNAVDKVIGQRLLDNVSILKEHILCISGRASFEIMQKALVARVTTIVAVGAPSSLAIDVAQRFRVRLIGFASRQRFNDYSAAS